MTRKYAYTACTVDEHVVAWVGDGEAIRKEPNYITMFIS